ncbi:CMRF35-like molecule 1 [Suncus etruscus]|uniref:CMRF35-like molecule 1 n=1 Tax=Suncus etruscus TaxID=109475 RepID=UPI0021108AED|nr:CMRF35-like molecule 1 [Suncus etruscus]
MVVLVVLVVLKKLLRYSSQYALTHPITLAALEQDCAHQSPREKMRPLGILILLCFLSRSATICGPDTVIGYVGGSVTVTCDYDVGYKKNGKWWSRGAASSSRRSLIETTGREQEAKRDRVTLRDIQREHRFIVTMEKLRLHDTDTYWCGIEMPGPDLMFRVTVAVGPGLFAPLLLSIIPAGLLLPLLVAVLLVWRKMKRQRTDFPSGFWAVLGVTQTDASTAHSNLRCWSLPKTGKSPETTPEILPAPFPATTWYLETQYTEDWSHEPVSRVGQDIQEGEFICYAPLSLSPQAPDSTYDNTDPDIVPSASRSSEVAMEYSSIRRPKDGL